MGGSGVLGPLQGAPGGSACAPSLLSPSSHGASEQPQVCYWGLAGTTQGSPALLVPPHAAPCLGGVKKKKKEEKPFMELRGRALFFFSFSPRIFSPLCPCCPCYDHVNLAPLLRAFLPSGFPELLLLSLLQPGSPGARSAPGPARGSQRWQRDLKVAECTSLLPGTEPGVLLAPRVHYQIFYCMFWGKFVRLSMGPPTASPLQAHPLAPAAVLQKQGPWGHWGLQPQAWPAPRAPSLCPSVHPSLRPSARGPVLRVSPSFHCSNNPFSTLAAKASPLAPARASIFSCL